MIKPLSIWNSKWWCTHSQSFKFREISRKTSRMGIRNRLSY